jgi:hypothetical protein
LHNLKFLHDGQKIYLHFFCICHTWLLTKEYDVTSLVYQNAINAPNTSFWTPFTTTITATTTAPTLPTSSQITSYYLQLGPTLRVCMSYVQYQTTGAVAGSGIYLFNLPPGFKANTNVVPVFSTSTYFTTPCIGTFNTCVGGKNSVDGTNINNSKYGAAILYDSTHYCGSSQNDYSYVYPWGTLVGDGGRLLFGVASSAYVTYSATFIIPINF